MFIMEMFFFFFYDFGHNTMIFKNPFIAELNP